MRDLGERELPGMSPGRVYELIGPSRPLTSRVLIRRFAAVRRVVERLPLAVADVELGVAATVESAETSADGAQRWTIAFDRGGNDLGGVSWSLPCLKNGFMGPTSSGLSRNVGFGFNV
ncbi:MAG: hypothetical protein WCE47_11015 [Gaiella sp.]|uniref:hypothetical protein n=1 Tax=Gaiella sp. TaxID=2663207 RepID=UPI003C78BDDF